MQRPAADTFMVTGRLPIDIEALCSTARYCWLHLTDCPPAQVKMLQQFLSSKDHDMQQTQRAQQAAQQELEQMQQQWRQAQQQLQQLNESQQQLQQQLQSAVLGRSNTQQALSDLNARVRIENACKGYLRQTLNACEGWCPWLF